MSFSYPAHIRKAVFPVAGLGTRFLPATKVLPKEMIPIIDKPLIQYAVEEAYAVGIRQMIFVTGRHKRLIEDHFDKAYELEATLDHSGKKTLLDMVKRIVPKDMQCFYVRQPKALGLGHAIYCARDIVGNEAFAVLLADDLLQTNPPILQQMIEKFQETRSSVLATELVADEDVSRYGIISGKQNKDQSIELDALIEKPDIQSKPSNFAIAGRYILTPAIFNEIAKSMAAATGKEEIQITDSLDSLLKHEKIFAIPHQGIRYDCGSRLGFLKAVTDFALSHPDIGESFSQWLKNKDILSG